MIADYFQRIADDLMSRVDGAMKLRLIMQPTVTSFFAIRAGLRDARINKPPFLKAFISGDVKSRRALITEGWGDMGKVFIAAFTLDIIYQYIDLKAFYLVEAIIVAIILTVIPYIVVRPITTRIASKVTTGKKQGE